MPHAPRSKDAARAARSGAPFAADLRRVSDSLARGLADTAAQREREGQLPHQEIEELRRAGLLGLPAPRKTGGPGGDWVDVLAVTRAISAADASIGQLVGYHYLNVVIADLVGTPTQVECLHCGLVDEGWFIGDSVNPLDPSLIVARSGDDIALNGRKTFSTGAAVADRILIAFMLGESTRFAIIPRERPGLVIHDDWDNFGQRLSASGSIDFNGVTVRADELLGEGCAPTSPRSTLVPPLIQSIFANVLLGLTQGSLNRAIEYTRAQSRPWFKSGVSRASDDPYILAEYGRLAAQLAGALAFADGVAATLRSALAQGPDLTAAERGSVAVESFKSRIVSTTVALEITSRIFELMGARATARKYGFDRYWRDARTLSLHDPIVYKAKEIGDFLVNGQVPEVSVYS
jgi:alkylation response protein AidB-like acyl-CoA dehydrogenase